MTVTECIDYLEKQGYTENYKIQNGQALDQNGKVFQPEQLKIDSTFRIENDSDPGNQVILFALSSEKSGSRGIIIDSYGPNSNSEKQDFIHSIAAAH